jgi:hypothetical protein
MAAKSWALTRELEQCPAFGGTETLWCAGGEPNVLTVRVRSLFGTNCSTRDDVFERLNRCAAPITIRTTSGFSIGVDRETRSGEGRTAWRDVEH